MMKIQIRQMTVSCRCSKLLSALFAVLTAVIPLSVSAQRTVWELPVYMETVSAGSVALGGTFARDTYLSASSYDGCVIGLEKDSWIGKNPDKLFRYGRSHAGLFLGYMENRTGRGTTLAMNGMDYAGFMWPAVRCNKCDLLVGPAALCEFGILYNPQNSNNPIDVWGHAGAGICVDNTFRFNVFRYGMALQASLYLPFAGIGFAPDYDQPYWYLVKYGNWDKAIHFIYPFNYLALTHQIAFVLPIKGNRLRIGYTFEHTGNELGGHSHSIGSNMLTIGCVMRHQTKKWDR